MSEYQKELEAQREDRFRMHMVGMLEGALLVFLMTAMLIVAMV